MEMEEVEAAIKDYQAACRAAHSVPETLLRTPSNKEMTDLMDGAGVYLRHSQSGGGEQIFFFAHFACIPHISFHTQFLNYGVSHVALHSILPKLGHGCRKSHTRFWVSRLYAFPLVFPHPRSPC